MEALSKTEVELFLKRLEEIVKDLEKNQNERGFYTFISLAQNLSGSKKEPFDIEQIGRLASLAERIIAIKVTLFPEASRSKDLYEALEAIASDAVYLARQYGA